MTRSLTPQEIVDVIQDYRSGLSIRQVAKSHYVSHPVVLAALQAAKEPRRPKTRKCART